MIPCEFTVHGNPCPDADCSLDHTLVILPVLEVETEPESVQLIMWNTRKGFGPAE